MIIDFKLIKSSQQRSDSRSSPALLDPCLCSVDICRFRSLLHWVNIIIFFLKSPQTDRMAVNFQHLAPISSNVFNYCVGNEHYFFQSPLSAILFTLEKPILFIYFLPRQSMASSASSYGSIRERLLQKLNQCTRALCASLTWSLAIPATPNVIHVYSYANPQRSPFEFIKSRSWPQRSSLDGFMAAYRDVKHAQFYNIAHINVRGCLPHPHMLWSHVMFINQAKFSSRVWKAQTRMIASLISAVASGRFDVHQ